MITFYQDYVEALVQGKDDEKALQVVESSRARVLAERTESTASLDEPFSLITLRALAASSHSSFLSLWLAPKRSYAWLLTEKGLHRFDLPPSAEIDRMVSGYREVVEHSLTDPAVSPVQSGSDLWSQIIAPVIPYVPPGTRLFVVPDGSLLRLNLETLLVPAPSIHYWLEDVELAVTPALAMLTKERFGSNARRSSILLIGDPDYAGTSYRALNSAGKEIRDIEKRFPDAERSIYSGVRASPAAYLDSNPAKFSIIHFAAHSEVAEAPLDSAVVLSPEGNRRKLYAREIVKIPIGKSLVTISACRGAGVHAYAGEGLIGLTWAFLHAGALAVTAGLWDVNDDSTEALMDHYYAGVAQGRSPQRSLREAKLFLLHSTEFHKPFYWAPFQVYTRSVANAF